MAPRADKVRFCRPASFPGLELVAASYGSRSFPTHSHEEYVIGVITGGAEWLVIRGERLLARAGDLILIEPHEAHSNESVGDAGIAYRVFYIPPAMVAAAFGEVRFAANVLPGGTLARQWAALHRRLAAGEQSLEVEGDVFETLDRIRRFAGTRIEADRPAEQARIARARSYLDARFAEPVSLADLANVAGLSPYHLVRSFRGQVGITPVAYQIQLRVAEARRRLRDGAPIAQTAAELGFADQSHLSRHFQRIFGTSPGRYTKQ